MVDAVTAEFLRPGGTARGDWRGEVRGLEDRMRSAMHRHPWLADLGHGFVQVELADQEGQRRTGLDLAGWMRRQVPHIESVARETGSRG
ncbi:hypothetical protein [Actinoallomurus iriomotensis]|uniref:Uncharacterized protein n=1 Tax=Actinoallomurus iriomotensis TaxID=478107 RepID=A0A9W6W0X9_9ACTN|nr:hypothetical protein [Actinoallomurus iriomotensis]GLY86197.1 hypothetical protein Airi02_041260 [Actinoallomurus iriomotensis]